MPKQKAHQKKARSPHAAKAPDGSTVLTVDSVDAHGKKCPAGTVIGPDVEGWPEHRVSLAVQHGNAEVVGEEDEDDAKDKGKDKDNDNGDSDS